MSNEVEIKGKSVEDALSQAEKQFNTTKDNIEYEVIEETNKTLFSILAPRYAIIKARVIDESKCKKQEKVNTEETTYVKKEYVEYDLDEETQNILKEKITNFLNEFLSAMELTFTFDISFEKNNVKVNINGDNSGILIGYRGEILDSLQTVINLVANRGIENHIRIQVDTEGYREKRKKTLENLAHRIADNVVRSRRDITLEPMVAYERKIIHSTLQENSKVDTKSVGEEPYRKVVIMYKK